MSPEQVSARPPVHVLTGFLGSGKTTLLRHFLASPDLRDTAVVINEFGEVGLDHLLVREVAEDVVLLASGCLCCVLRDDLVSTLIDLRRAAATAEIPPFSRVIVETTGLADPMPILQAILAEKQLARQFRLGQVVTTVDAVNGSATLARHTEAMAQVGAAETLVVTKTDLASPTQVTEVEACLAEANPSARRLWSRADRVPDATDLFGEEGARGEWPAGGGIAAPPSRHTHGHLHTGGISSFTITLDCPVDVAAFTDWLELLLAARGEQVLRVKGYLATTGCDTPLAIQGVQHVVYRPEPLREWPSTPGLSELVFIARDLTRRAIEQSLRSIVRTGAPAHDQFPLS